MSQSKLLLYCLKYAESVLRESMFFYKGSAEKYYPISFAIYLIKIGQRNVLVDAGCETMPGFEMNWICSPTTVLEQIGLNNADITDVIITHAHHDHIEAVKHFPNASIYISKKEYQQGKKYIPEGFKVITFENKCFFAPNVKIVEWGGHSQGSAIVEIETKEITHIIAGDECYINDCIKNKIPTGSYYNLAKSREFVEKYNDSLYCVHTCHDAELKTERII